MAKSDIVDLFEKKERIRTMNYRGSVLCTTCVLPDVVGKAVAYLTPISYSSSIKCVSSTIKTLGTALTYYIYGINPDGTYSTDTILGANGSIGTIVPGDGKTIYQALCDVKGNPTDRFKPYKDHRYGMLAVASSEEIVKGDAVSIMFVEGAPSEAPLISKSVKSKSGSNS